MKYYLSYLMLLFSCSLFMVGCGKAQGNDSGTALIDEESIKSVLYQKKSVVLQKLGKPYESTDLTFWYYAKDPKTGNKSKCQIWFSEPNSDAKANDIHCEANA